MKQFRIHFETNGNPCTITISGKSKKEALDKFEDFAQDQYPGYEVKVKETKEL